MELNKKRLTDRKTVSVRRHFFCHKLICMVKKTKRTFSVEEQEFLRAEWRRMHPEEAARRDAKRNLAKEEKAKLQQEKEDFEQENLVLSEPPKEELSVEEYRKRIHALWEDVRQKREQYVKERVLADTVLTEEQKRDFRYFVTNNYDIENQVLAAVTSALLVEGLRYPDKELNDFSFNFLREKESAENDISWSFWIQVWDQEFVPLDAVRLMLDIDDGKFRALDRFRGLVDIISSKILRHLDQEYHRLEWSRSLEDPNIRTREVGRKCRRIFYFQVLLGAYGIEFPRAYY